MTLQEKIIELLPKEITLFSSKENELIDLAVTKKDKSIHTTPMAYERAYNDSLQDVKEKLPEILKLIREEVEKLPRTYNPVSIRTPVHTDGYGNVSLKEVLELLK